MKRRVLPSADLPLSVKDDFTTSLVDSRAFYCCHVWSATSWQELVALDAPRLQAWRVARGLHNAGEPHDYRVTDAAMWSMVRKLPATETIKLARLRYLPRFVRAAPPQLAAMVQGCSGWPRSWQELLLQDVECALTLAPRDHPAHGLPSPRHDAAPLMAYLKAGAEAWRQLVQLVAKKKLAETREWAEGVLRGFPGGGVPAAAAEGPVPVCPECAAEFPSEAALASHRARKHNYVNDHRHYVHGATC